MPIDEQPRGVSPTLLDVNIPPEIASRAERDFDGLTESDQRAVIVAVQLYASGGPADVEGEA